MSGLHRFMTPKGRRTVLASLGLLLLALAAAGCEPASDGWIFAR